MNTKIIKSAAITGVGLIALSVGGTVWAAGCIDANPKYPITSDLTTFVDPLDPDTYVAPDESIPAPSVTEFDGNLTCDSTSGYFGGFIANGSGTETFTSPDGKMQFTVTSFLDNGKAVWNVIQDVPLQPGVMTELRGIDSTISASNKGSKGCNTTFGVDAGSGESAFEKNNGSLVASDLYVCANGIVDSVPGPPPPPVAEVKGCVLSSAGDSVEIYNVTIQCTDLLPGEQRTIFVAKDIGDINPDPNIIDIDVVPGFGFANEEGVIDFNNVCICKGPSIGVIETECYPDPLNPVPGLELCTVNDAVPSLEVEIQNPRCVTYGGSRRCY